MSLLRFRRRLIFEVVYQLGPKNCFAISGIKLYLTCYIPQFLVTQRILAETKNSLRYIRHLVVSDFAISGFNYICSKLLGSRVSSTVLAGTKQPTGNQQDWRSRLCYTLTWLCWLCGTYAGNLWPVFSKIV